MFRVYVGASFENDENNRFLVYNKRIKPIKEMNSMSKDNNGVIVAAIVGGAAGAIAALLLAPKSGRELRSDVFNTAQDLQGKGERLLKRALKRSEEAVEETADLLDKAQALYGEAMESSAKLMEQIKNSKTSEQLTTSLSEDVLSENKTGEDKPNKQD
jgi:gas vesicle protein